MNESVRSPYLNLLRDRIDIMYVPFSDRGSRLLVYKYVDRHDLYIKLAERLTDIQPGLEAYLSRPPYIEQLCFLDESGTPLVFHLITYPHALFFQTRLGTFTLTFFNANTIAIGLPPGICAGIRLRIHAKIGQKLERGGSLIAVRRLVYQTNGTVIRNEITSEQNVCRLELVVNTNDDTAIHLNIQKESGLDGEMASFSHTLEAAEKRWHDWFAAVPKVIDSYQLHYYYAWWVMFNNLVNPRGRIAQEAMMPSKKQYIGIWNWDACFHTLAFRHLDPELARDQIRTILACQLPDGMIPDVVYDEGIVIQLDHPIEGKVTKPPFIAWAALKLHEWHPDIRFLKEIYASLVRWNSWWFSMNDDDADGLVQYNHPYSSGLDNSPLWDHGMPVESPDLNTYLSIQMESLAIIAEALGLVDQAGMWRRRVHTIVQRMLQDFYDPNAGLFWATQDHKPIREVTLFNLLPLWTGNLPEGVQEKLIEHLTNKDEFWGPYPLATLARNSQNYSPQKMWRGPTWINFNYIFIEALNLIDRTNLANQLRDETLALILKNDGIYEYYNSETGEPGERAVNMFGWTAAIFIDLVLQVGSVQKGL